MDDSMFCRKCGLPRPGADHESRRTSKEDPAPTDLNNVLGEVEHDEEEKNRFEVTEVITSEPFVPSQPSVMLNGAQVVQRKLPQKDETDPALATSVEMMS